MIPVADLIALVGGTEDDAVALADLEINALAFVQIQTDRYFGPPELFEEFVTGNGTRRLWLRDHPTQNPSDAYADLVDVAEREYPGATATDIEEGEGFDTRLTDREFSLVRLGDAVWTQGYEYGCEYWRGYAEGDEPGDIRQLVMDLIGVRWGLQSGGAYRSEQIGGYSYTRFGESDLDAVMGGWATVHSWRRPVYA